ncbi:MAG: tetratricopeptide repeat protein [Pelosinus sp.]|nr:tetratricopeptide repeat protein [Pelosinus sp.]
MEYIFIIFMTIIITTILVYPLANLVLGIHLRWKPLALCAVCSMVISLVLPHVVVGFAGLAGSMALLAVCAVVFAYFVAKYDAYDERKLAAQQLAAAPAEQWPFDDAAQAECALAQSQAALCTADLVPAKEDDSGPQTLDLLENRVEPNLSISASLPEETKSEPETREMTVLIENPITPDIHDENEPAPESQPLVQADKQLDQPVAESILEENDSMPIAAQNVQADEAAVSQIDTAESQPDKELAAEALMATEKTLDDTAMVGEQIVKIEAIDEIQTLDELMDYAYDQQEQKNIQQAFAAFRKALTLYGESESAPFIVIEMGNILKNKGAYDEAIQVFSEGRNLPALQYDDLLEQEFVSTIAYLRIVKNILLAQRLGFIPYNEIPGAVFAEINAEFSEWRDLA